MKILQKNVPLKLFSSSLFGGNVCGFIGFCLFDKKCLQVGV
jgi:hypothetical protein